MRGCIGIIPCLEINTFDFSLNNIKGGFYENKRTWFYSSLLSVLLLVACTGASSDGQLVGEKITDWSATVTPGKVSSDRNEVNLHSKNLGPFGEVMATVTFVSDGTISGNGLSFQAEGKVIPFPVLGLGQR